MMAVLHVRLHITRLSGLFTTHFFRVGGSVSRSLFYLSTLFSRYQVSTGSDTMKIEGWKTQHATRYYIGATTPVVHGSASAATSKRKYDGASKRKREINYGSSIDFNPRPLAFHEDFPVCTPRYA